MLYSSNTVSESYGGATCSPGGADFGMMRPETSWSGDGTVGANGRLDAASAAMVATGAASCIDGKRPCGRRIVCGGFI